MIKKLGIKFKKQFEQNENWMIKYYKRKIQNDNNAKASFALVGVIILLLANVNVVYIITVSNNYRDSIIETGEIEKMNAAINKVHIEIQTVAYFQALDSIQDTDLYFPEQSPNILFNDSFEEYVEENFPRTIRSCEVYINEYYVLIIPDKDNQTTITSDCSLNGYINYIAKEKSFGITLGKNLNIEKNVC